MKEKHLIFLIIKIVYSFISIQHLFKIHKKIEIKKQIINIYLFNFFNQFIQHRHVITKC